MRAMDLPDGWWDVLRPEHPCECGQTFDGDLTEVGKSADGGLTLKCPNPQCGKVWRMRMRLE